MAIERYLSAKQIQEILGCSRSRAHEIAAECTRVAIGKRAIRVPESAFRRWIERRTIAPTTWAVDFDHRRRVMRGPLLAAASDDDVPTRLTFPRTKPRAVVATADEPIRPIVPRTKPKGQAR